MFNSVSTEQTVAMRKVRKEKS